MCGVFFTFFFFSRFIINILYDMVNKHEVFEFVPRSLYVGTNDGDFLDMNYVWNTNKNEYSTRMYFIFFITE